MLLWASTVPIGDGSVRCALTYVVAGVDAVVCGCWCGLVHMIAGVVAVMCGCSGVWCGCSGVVAVVWLQWCGCSGVVAVVTVGFS